MTRKYVGNGKWVKRPSKSPKEDSKSNSKNTPSSSSSGENKDNKSKNKDKKGKVSKKTKREYIDKEINTLRGTVELRTPISDIKSNTSVTLKGFGAVLSGNYYVEEVEHVFDSSGYSQRLEVSRNSFNDPMVRKVSSVKPEEVVVGGRKRKYPNIMK